MVVYIKMFSHTPTASKLSVSENFYSLTKSTIISALFCFSPQMQCDCINRRQRWQLPKQSSLLLDSPPAILFPGPTCRYWPGREGILWLMCSGSSLWAVPLRHCGLWHGSTAPQASLPTLNNCKTEGQWTTQEPQVRAVTVEDRSAVTAPPSGAPSRELLSNGV